MSRPKVDGLEGASGTEIATASPTVLQTIPVRTPGQMRGVRLHLDLVNGGTGATEVTISINIAVPLVFNVSVPSKTLEQLDFYVDASASGPVTVTAQAAAADVFAIGYQEIWS